MTTRTESSLSAQVGEFMEGAQHAVADPWPLYSRLRKEAPVYIEGDVVLVTRYGDVLQLLQDPRMSTRKYDTDLVDNQIASLSPKDAEIAKEWLGFQKMILGASDPPDHTRRRKLQIHGFMPRQLNAVEDYVQVTTDRLLDRLEQHGEMDFVAHLAYQLPMMVIAHLLGVPEEDMPRILAWSQDVGHVMGRGFHHAPERAAGLRGFMDYVTATVEARRSAPRDDLLGALIAAEEEGDKLTTQELIVSFFNLLFSGHETTTTLLANGMLAFLRNPDQWQLVCADPGRADDAVEELLRYVTPVSWVTRVAMEDVELQGQVIHRGPSIKLVLGSANHDPDHFNDPERFDIDRQDEARGLFFGKGIHYCMGNALARLEAKTAFATLARRFPGVRQVTDSLEWRPNPLMRRVAALPVAVSRSV
jgi:cytochrome P450